MTGVIQFETVGYRPRKYDRRLNTGDGSGRRQRHAPIAILVLVERVGVGG